MAEIRGSKVLVVGGAGFIGSHVVDELLRQDVGQVVVYDNFCRGTLGNLEEALKDPRVRINEVGGEILQPDILGAAVKDADLVVHLAALWLLQCHEYPASAFEVNIRGTFNVLEACRQHGTRTSIREVCELLLELTGSSLAIQYEPAGQTFVTNRIGSTDRAEADLGFRTGVELRDGLVRLIQWRKAHQERCR